MKGFSVRDTIKCRTTDEGCKCIINSKDIRPFGGCPLSKLFCFLSEKKVADNIEHKARKSHFINIHFGKVDSFDNVTKKP